MALGVGEAAPSAQRKPSDGQRFKLLAEAGTGAPGRQKGSGQDMTAPNFANSVGKTS